MTMLFATIHNFLPVQTFDPFLGVLVLRGHLMQSGLDSCRLMYPTGQATQSFEAESYFIPRGQLTEIKENVISLINVWWRGDFDLRCDIPNWAFLN